MLPAGVDHNVTADPLRCCLGIGLHGFVKIIVGIQEGQVIPPGLVQADVPGSPGIQSAEAGENMQPGIPGSIGFQNGQGAVRGFGIHAEDLDLLQGLAQDAVQTLGQIGFPIINRYDHRNHTQSAPF